MYDGHGNVVRTIDTSFGLSAYQWRGVWGERQTPALQTGKGYCANLGHQEDETGLVYMRARYYEPTTGRFISEDPGRDGVNWYLYADGNAVNKVDFTGKNPDFSWYASMYIATGQKWFARGALEDFIGLSVDQKWVDQLVKNTRYLGHLGLLSFLLGLFGKQFPKDSSVRTWTPVGTASIKGVQMYAFMLWVALTGCDIA